MNTKIRVTKSFTFDMAHALYGYDGPCKNIHGHTYHLYVTLLGKPIEDIQSPKNGMVYDFGEMKQIIKEFILDEFDHSLVLNANSAHSNLRMMNEQFEKIRYAPYQPTCENLLLDFQERIKNKFPLTLTLYSLKLEETPTSYAEWFASDNLSEVPNLQTS